MVEHIPTASAKDTVATVMTHLAQHAKQYASVSYVYVLSPGRQLEGVVSIKELFTHSPQTLIATVMNPQPIVADAAMTAEALALLAINHRLKAVPVVEVATGRLLGVVTSDVVHDILHYGRIHDALRAVGAEPFDEPRVSLVAGTPLLHIRKRLPWLLFGLLGGLAAAMIVRLFEAELAAEVLIVAFIPLVVYLADAVGSQTEIIFVRAIALEPALAKPVRFAKYFYRELVVTTALALILGVLVAGITVWWFAAPQLAILMLSAIVSTLLLSMVVALCIPYLAVRMSYDPALTSGPVATVIRDVLTLVVYFIIVAIYLGMS